MHSTHFLKTVHNHIATLSVILFYPMLFTVYLHSCMLDFTAAVSCSFFPFVTVLTTTMADRGKKKEEHITAVC